MLSYIYSCYGPYFTTMLPPSLIYQSIMIPQEKIEVMSESPSIENPKKYHRTWKKHQVEEIFSTATKYCKDNDKKIEELTLSDFRIISLNSNQSPEQVMNKVNEIHISGTLRPGIWSLKEDEMLTTLLRKGIAKWGQIANLLNNEIHKGLKIRTGKQCKERWNNYLNPNMNRGAWTEEEDICILENYKIHGNKWSVISKMLCNRTESAVKNRIKSVINKIKQDLNSMDDLKIGIDSIIEMKKRKILQTEDSNRENIAIGESE